MPKLLAPITFGTRLRRLAWHITYLFIYRPTPVFAHVWRCLILKMFGAEISLDAFPYPDARIWAPWNLVMKRGSCLGPNANCYNPARIVLHENALISQGAHLCSASHDYNLKEFPLTGAPITIGPSAWIAADVFVGPGVTVSDYGVALARAVIVKDIPSNDIVAGNPARRVGIRELGQGSE